MGRYRRLCGASRELLEGCRKLEKGFSWDSEGSCDDCAAGNRQGLVLRSAGLRARGRPGAGGSPGGKSRELWAAPLALPASSDKVAGGFAMGLVRFCEVWGRQERGKGVSWTRISGSFRGRFFFSPDEDFRSLKSYEGRENTGGGRGQR